MLSFFDQVELDKSRVCKVFKYKCVNDLIFFTIKVIWQHSIPSH